MPKTPAQPDRNTREILRRVAPCGLYCGGCLAFADGPIRGHAQALAGLLGPNFAPYAQRLAAMNPVLEDYPIFARVLEFLAQGSCSGCRDGGCLFQECGVRPCALGRGLDFCGQCPDFPCPDPGLPESLLKAWRRNNERLRDHGPAAFLEFVSTKPRYP